ncbi:ATP-binding protein [Streptomyces sp. NPDC059247]|uniref:ATP-binding protein n=1 Tax=Streptomyces sp. NPDC059247 TaxID=3346790 RepID=UPI00367C9EAE
MSASPTPLRPALITSSLTTAAGGAIAAAAVTAAPPGVRTALAWIAACGVLLLSAAAFAVTWYARTSRAHGRRAAGLAAELSSWETYAAQSKASAERETTALKERFEAETARLEQRHRSETADASAAQAARLEELVRAHTAETTALARARAADAEGARLRLRRAESGRSAAMAASANAAGRMQALATSMLADLREMEHRHADEDVLTDLLHLDHRTAQAGRLADSVAVLTGARSGRRWARPIVMESILRGAMGRIGGYQRVRLHSSSDAAVAGHAAEGVMHALAELMDNAANFSPPTAEVHVYVEEVPAGVMIAVEDSGLVMSDVQLRRAESAVGAVTQDLAGLSGTRLGLAVVGRLARKHGLTVSFRPSARGGTGALLMLPQELISRASAETRTAPEAAGNPADAPETQASPAPGTALSTAPETAGTPAPSSRTAPDPAAPVVRIPAPRTEPGSTPDAGAENTGEHPRFGESGLPQRRRGRALAAAHPEGPDAAPKPRKAAAPRTGAAAGAATRFGSFRQAVRAAAQPDAPTGGERDGAAETGDRPESPGAPTPGDGPGTDGVSPAGAAHPADGDEAPAAHDTPNSPHPEGTSR